MAWDSSGRLGCRGPAERHRGSRKSSSGTRGSLGGAPWTAPPPAPQDIAVEEGLEPPVPTAPGWHLLEENNGVKRWRAFAPEMQKQLENLGYFQR